MRLPNPTLFSAAITLAAGIILFGNPTSVVVTTARLLALLGVVVLLVGNIYIAVKANQVKKEEKK